MILAVILAVIRGPWRFRRRPLGGTTVSIMDDPGRVDPAQVRRDLGLPGSGPLDRDQALRLLLTLFGQPPAAAVAWSRRALGVSVGSAPRSA